jgi:hypothetical protein
MFVYQERAIMKVSLRVAAVTGILIVLLSLRQAFKQEHAPTVPPSGATLSDGSDGWPSPEDKVVVVPKMTGEDTDWLSPDLPE